MHTSSGDCNTGCGLRGRGVWLWLGLGAIIAVGASLIHQFLGNPVHKWFGPPSVVMVEQYEQQTSQAIFDHSQWDDLVRTHVKEGGWVDYKAIYKNPSGLDQYIQSLAHADIDVLGRDERLAFLINAYNAFTVRLILDHWPISSIKDIPAGERWQARRWSIAGQRYSLNQIEHEQVRPNFREPRIHFALVCAAVGCPPLRPEAYTGSRLDHQLEDQTRLVHQSPRWVRIEGSAIMLTPLYQWYRGDFEQVAGSLMGFLGRYVDGIKESHSSNIRWIDYDWSLNNLSYKAGHRG